MNINFNDQIVLITGATRGIGKQIADDLIALGAKLILTGTNKDQIKKLNKSMGNDNVRYYHVDFTSKKSTLGFVKQISKMKRIDVCINNAGINKIDYIDETNTKDWDDIIAVNLTAPFLIMRTVSRIMKRNKYGRIVNIASIFSVISKEKRSIYSASKFGLNGLTKSISNELAKYNVLVNSVSPGFVLTDLTKNILSGREIKKLSKQVPIKRFAMPDEIARVILFLASRTNTYLTGQNIVVDGGFVNV